MLLEFSIARIFNNKIDMSNAAEVRDSLTDSLTQTSNPYFVCLNFMETGTKNHYTLSTGAPRKDLRVEEVSKEITLDGVFKEDERRACGSLRR